MKTNELNEFQPPADTDTLKQKIFTDMANLTEYVKKINEQLRTKLREQNENL